MGLPFGSFRHDPEPKDIVPAFLNTAGGVTNQGKQLSAAGGASFDQVLAHLAKITSGDRQALFEETAPETNRVIDQYDTARKSAAQFGTRGGGTATANREARTAQAGAVGSTIAGARQQGFGQLGDLAKFLTSSGLQAQGEGLNAVSQIISAAYSKDAASSSMWGNIAAGAGEAGGALLAALLFA
jgi:hypothetical protein